jgi:hypothetical protein
VPSLLLLVRSSRLVRIDGDARIQAKAEVGLVARPTPLCMKARRAIRRLVDDRERLVRQRVGLIPRWNDIGTILGELELPA